MSQMLLTILLSIILVVLALAGLAIGYIITGKPRLTRGTCGWNPRQANGKRAKTDVKCGLCGAGPDEVCKNPDDEKSSNDTSE